MTIKAKRICGLLFVAVLVTLIGGQVEAVTIIDTFPEDTYHPALGWSISSPSSSPYGDIDQGDQFTPGEPGFYLDTIELALWLSAGVNQLDVWLMSDANGEPGDLIETFTFDTMEESPGGVITANSTERPVLEAGTPYWLIASTEGLGTKVGWYLSYPPVLVSGSHAEGKLMEGTWTWTISAHMGAFRVSGTPVPEPATMLLFGSGLLGMAAGLRKKARKKKHTA